MLHVPLQLTFVEAAMNLPDLPDFLKVIELII